MLRLLVDNRPRALSKAELLERVWPGVFVSDASLARVINEIRDAIGDRARPAHIVRTVHGYGYAFAAEIKGEERRQADAGAPGRPACWFIWRRRVFALPEGQHIARREPDVSIWLDSPKVSRHHARVLVRDARTTIEDLDSKNGTFVRGSRISAPTALERGEVRHWPLHSDLSGRAWSDEDRNRDSPGTISISNHDPEEWRSTGSLKCFITPLRSI